MQKLDQLFCRILASECKIALALASNLNAGFKPYSKRQINSCGLVLALKANLIKDEGLDQSFCELFLGMIIFVNLLQHANVLSYPLYLCEAMMQPVVILPRFSGYPFLVEALLVGLSSIMSPFRIFCLFRSH